MSTKILISGAFDPLHIGHILLLKEASEYGDVVVALNSDEWIIKKNRKS
jgi:cytidyltransferase-like protein